MGEDKEEQERAESKSGEEVEEGAVHRVANPMSTGREKEVKRGAKRSIAFKLMSATSFDGGVGVDQGRSVFRLRSKTNDRGLRLVEIQSWLGE